MKYTLTQVQSEVMKILEATINICDRNDILYYAQAGTVLGAIRHHGPIPWDYDADIIVPNNLINRFVECVSRELPDKYYVDHYTLSKDSKRQFPRIGLKGYNTEVIHLDVFRLIGLPDERAQQELVIKEAKDYERNAAIMRKYSLRHLIFKRKDLKHALGKLGLTKDTIRHNIMLFEEICGRYDYDRASYVSNPSGKYGVKNIFRKEIYGEGTTVDFMDFHIRIPSEYDFYLKQYYGDYMKFPPEDMIKKEMEKTFTLR